MAGSKDAKDATVTLTGRDPDGRLAKILGAGATGGRK